MPFCTFSDAYYSFYLRKRYGISPCTCYGSLPSLCNDYNISKYIHNQTVVDNTQENGGYLPIVKTTERSFFVAVKVGTNAAIVAGLLEGATTFTDPALKDHYVIVTKGNFGLPPYNPGDGSQYFTKIVDSDTITFSDPLQEGETVQIFTIQ